MKSQPQLVTRVIKITHCVVFVIGLCSSLLVFRLAQPDISSKVVKHILQQKHFVS